MANIYDVARSADVSVATVSAVVNGSAYVSPRLKARVEAAIRSLGYQPNHLARGLATDQSRTLGRLWPAGKRYCVCSYSVGSFCV